MKNISEIYKFASVFRKLATDERHYVGELNDGVIIAITQLMGLANEDFPNMLEMLEIIDGVKNDPNYKFLFLDKLESALNHTINNIHDFGLERYKQIPVQYKTFSNEKLEILLSTTFEQLKFKLINALNKEKTLKENDTVGHERINEYKEHIKDLMSDKGRAALYYKEIKFVIKINNEIENIKSLINNIYMKAAQKKEQAEKRNDIPEIEEVPEKQKKKKTIKKEKYEESNEESETSPVIPYKNTNINESGDLVIPDSIAKLTKLINFIQENVGNALKVGLSLKNYDDVRRELLGELNNSQILSYYPSDDKRRGETVKEFINLLKKYMEVVSKFVKNTGTMAELRSVIRRRDKSEIQANPELIKLKTMFEKHLSDIKMYISKLEQLAFDLYEEREAV